MANELLSELKQVRSLNYQLRVSRSPGTGQLPVNQIRSTAKTYATINTMILPY